MTVLLPWAVRRHVLRICWGYRIPASARIGWAWIYPKVLVMGEGASIGHLNVAIHLERLELGAGSTIGRSNWITGYPKAQGRHFQHQLDREPALVLGEQSAITKNHHFDCTARIDIGAFSTVAGYQSQFLTHSIDIVTGRQHSESIRIGSYCFVGTRCVVLSGAALPGSSVLGAASLLNKAHDQPFMLYAGSPARPVKKLAHDSAYFCRQRGFVE